LRKLVVADAVQEEHASDPDLTLSPVEDVRTVQSPYPAAEAGMHMNVHCFKATGDGCKDVGLF